MTHQKAHAEGFGIIPNWIVRETDLTAYALLVYVALSGRANRDGEAWPAISRIAREARCSESTARKAIKELRESGLVTIRQRHRDDGAQTSNVYRVHLHASGRAKSPLRVAKGAGSDDAPAPFATHTQRRHMEEDPDEEDTYQELKSIASDRRPSKAHRSDVRASDDQIQFMKDCYIMLHNFLPDPTDVTNWAQMSSADAHAYIGEMWPEIEQGRDDVLVNALEFEQDLSPKALAFIDKRLTS